MINAYDILGTVGVAIIILTYVLLQAERIRSDQLAYSVLNAVGAALASGGDPVVCDFQEALAVSIAAPAAEPGGFARPVGSQGRIS